MDMLCRTYRKFFLEAVISFTEVIEATLKELIVQRRIISPVNYLDGPHYTLHIYDAEMITQDQLELSSISRIA